MIAVKGDESTPTSINDQGFHDHYYQIALAGEYNFGQGFFATLSEKMLPQSILIVALQ
jgi:hypothetical protein